MNSERKFDRVSPFIGQNWKFSVIFKKSGKKLLEEKLEFLHKISLWQNLFLFFNVT